MQQKPDPLTKQLIRISAVVIILAGSVGGALALAILLDRLDKRFRYPTQVTSDLGLAILGVVPPIDRTPKGKEDADATMQVVESFRSIRLAIQHASGDQDQVVERDGSGKPTSALVASLRLPLPKGVIAGVDDFVELDFKFVTATQTGPFTVAGAGTFEVEILADSISFGPLTFTPTNNRLAMKVQNMPDHETEWPDEGHVFTGHHMDVMYPLLSGKPSAPTVRITGRPKFDAVGAATSVWRRGVDPAQCTPAVV